MKRTNIISILLFTLIAVSSCGGNSKDSDIPYIKMEGMVWNTVYHVTFRGDASLKDSIIKTLDDVSSTFNIFDDSSLVSRINRQDSTPVNDDFIKVYAMSIKINRLSGGAFDPTIGPLIKAWGFGKGHTPDSDTLRIDSLIQFCGIDKTHISHDALIKDDIRTQFNFSAIAKGYGCDRIGEVLKEAGVSDWLVEIGGEIAAAGKSPSGEDWKISVDKPIFNNDSVIHDSQTIIAFTDMGMATSGNYRNFRNDGAISYGHTISPVTGRPIQTDIISATVLAPSSMIADALATAFMAMGSEPAIEINARLHLPVMLVLADSTIWASEQFRNLEIAK